jgi:hypothetical protein
MCSTACKHDIEGLHVLTKGACLAWGIASVLLQHGYKPADEWTGEGIRARQRVWWNTRV